MNGLYDLVNQGLLGLSIVPQTIASATTTNGTAVDCSLSEGLVSAVFCTGNITGSDTTVTAALTECDTSGGSYTAVKDQTGTAVATATYTGATAGDNLILPLKGVRTKKYVRLEVTTTGASVSVPCCGLIEARKKISGSGTGYVS